MTVTAEQKPLKSRSLASPGAADPWADDGGAQPVEVGGRGVLMDTLLQQPAPPPSPASDAFASLMEGAADLFRLNDFTGSLETVEKALELRPEDVGARDLLRRNQDALLKMFEAKLGGLSRRPRVRVNPSEIMWLNIDHRAGFVLSQIDGFVSYDEIITLSGMTRFETCRILAKLVEEGAIETKV